METGASLDIDLRVVLVFSSDFFYLFIYLFTYLFLFISFFFTFFFLLFETFESIRKHTYSNILKISETESFPIKILIQIQSNLVISNSLISNYHLSRSENLVPVLT